MANLMASHGATAMPIGLASFSGAPQRLFAALAAWHSARQIRRLDAAQRRDAGLSDPFAPRVAVQPGWDLPLQGLR